MDLPLNNLDFEDIVKEAEKELEIADLGCGEAEYHSQLYDVLENKLAEAGHEGSIKLYGIDTDEEKLVEARDNNPQPEFQYLNENLEDSGNYSLEDFDIVVSKHLFCETDKTQEVYNEADRLAKDIDGKNQVHSRC